LFFFFQAEDGIRDFHVTGVQTCALPICFDGCSSGGADHARAHWGGRLPVRVETSAAVEPADTGGATRISGPAGSAGSERSGTRRSEERRVGKECRARWSAVRQ